MFNWFLQMWVGKLMSPFGSDAFKILTALTLWRQENAFDLNFYLIKNKWN